MKDKIELAHGFGGRLTQELIDSVILPALGAEGHTPTLDAAVLSELTPPVVVSTDSFTVTPRFFPGGDIGKLALCGTINDVAMMGAKARFVALSLILEEGFPVSELADIMRSLGQTARENGVQVVTGDTKVVGQGQADGIFITTTGFGAREFTVGPERIQPGDRIIVSGTIADHGAAILNARENLGFSKTLKSDCAPLWDLVQAAAKAGAEHLHALRDPTRGGLAATLNEFVQDTNLTFLLSESALPIRPEVKSFLEVLGLDPLPLANEGKCLLFVAPEAAEKVLAAVKKAPHGENATIIGHVEKPVRKGRLILETTIGTRRVIEMPLEPGLPRIC